MTEPKPGEAVSFFDAWRQERKTGAVIEMRRSERHPWRVAIVQLQDGTEAEMHPDRLEKIIMTEEEMIRRTAQINFDIVITHGLSDAGVGFEWHGLLIHDPFTDPQYGAFPVDPFEQYGAAYTESIFTTDPAKALQMAQRQLREKANEDLNRYCVEHDVDAATVIENACGAKVMEFVDPLKALTDEQVEAVWSHVDGTSSGSGRIESSVRKTFPTNGK